MVTVDRISLKTSMAAARSRRSVHVATGEEVLGSGLKLVPMPLVLGADFSACGFWMIMMVVVVMRV